MNPEEAALVIARLESSIEENKCVFVRRVAEQLGLECRLIARDEDRNGLQSLQLRGFAEVSVRLSDQLRDYERGPGHGRPDKVFIDMLIEYGEVYSLREQIAASLRHSVVVLHSRGLVN